MAKEVICIVCPIGCPMEVKKEGKEYKVTGNTCKRGYDYAIKEVTNPTRTVTSTVKIKNASLNRLPVRTDKAIPKDKIFDCMKLINEVEINAPIKMGDIIIENILDINVNLIASRDLD
ncbi:DUF1667 domain-containing protein [Dethiothermospora halolimnae]|uniref:DUF1667 domain-containing protein n=1 Tax=Dethiothermospora halolimnae TaxID=3114390 RepID=UPI003CCC3DA4